MTLTQFWNEDGSESNDTCEARAFYIVTLLRSGSLRTAHSTWVPKHVIGKDKDWLIMHVTPVEKTLIFCVTTHDHEV